MGHWVLWKRFLFGNFFFGETKIAPNFWEFIDSKRDVDLMWDKNLLRSHF